MRRRGKRRADRPVAPRRPFAASASVDGVGDAIAGRPRVWTCRHRKCFMKGAQATADRVDRRRRIGLPPSRDGAVTVETGRDDPGTVRVGALVEQSRHWRPLRCPNESLGLPAEIDASRRCPLHKQPVRPGADLERDAAALEGGGAGRRGLPAITPSACPIWNCRTERRARTPIVGPTAPLRTAPGDRQAQCSELNLRLCGNR